MYFPLGYFECHRPGLLPACDVLHVKDCLFLVSAMICLRSNTWPVPKHDRLFPSLTQPSLYICWRGHVPRRSAPVELQVGVETSDAPKLQVPTLSNGNETASEKRCSTQARCSGTVVLDLHRLWQILYDPGRTHCFAINLRTSAGSGPSLCTDWRPTPGRRMNRRTPGAAEPTMLTCPRLARGNLEQLDEIF